jgi:anaerobic C4-dicarboxylate transporter
MLNHSFMRPGLVSAVSATIVALVLAQWIVN